MMLIHHSVGAGGVNKRDDIMAVQAALNALASLMPGFSMLDVDGLLTAVPDDSHTVAAIKLFQQHVVGMNMADGRIDVGGRTHNTINEQLTRLYRPADYVLPTPRPSAPLQLADYQRVAAHIGCDAAAVRAVASVESATSAFLDDWRPKILFEAHVFSRQTAHQYDAQYPSISSPHWNRTLYLGGKQEYLRLAQALALNPQAALKSASWGRFQIMGFNCQLCGYSSVKQFVSAMYRSERQHLDAFVGFIQRRNLAHFLTTKDWPAFARGYNGPGYAQHQYDRKMAQAYAKFSLDG